MIIYHKSRKNSDISYNFQMKTIRKNKQLLIVTFFYCEKNHNLSLNQFVTYLNWLKNTINIQIFLLSQPPLWPFQCCMQHAQNMHFPPQAIEFTNQNNMWVNNLFSDCPILSRVQARISATGVYSEPLI